MMFIVAINSFVIHPGPVHRSREMWEFPCGSTHVPTTGSSVSTISLDTLINRLISALQRGRENTSEILDFYVSNDTLSNARHRSNDFNLIF